MDWTTGMVEWWNTGMVDWIVFHFVFNIYHVVASLLCLHLPKLLALLHIYNSTYRLVS